MTKHLNKLFWVAGIITILIFLLNFYLVGFGVFGDGLGYYTPLRSLIFDGDFRIADEYEYLSNSASKFGGGLRVTTAIPEYSKYTMGMGLVLAPFYLLGHLFTLVLNGLGLNVETNGLSWTYELFYCLGSILLGISGLILAYQTARRFFSPLASTLAVIGVWFASPLTFYLTLEASMSHAVSQFLISLLLYLCITTSWFKQRKYQILIGIVLGLAVLVRPQNLLFGIVPILIGLWAILPQTNKIKPDRDREELSTQIQEKTTQKSSFSFELIKQYLNNLIWIGMFTFLMLIPQIFVFVSQYGSLGEISYLKEGAEQGYGSSFNWLQPEIFKVLFSGFHGLFAWHPLLILGVVGLMISKKPMAPLGWILLVAFFLQVYFIGSWWAWWQGASFGGRMFCNCSLIFILGLAAFWDRFKSKAGRISAVVITVFFLVWNALLVMQYESAMIPPEEPISVAELFKNQFLVIPFFLNHVFNR
jgi:hypothetical protein